MKEKSLVYIPGQGKVYPECSLCMKARSFSFMAQYKWKHSRHNVWPRRHGNTNIGFLENTEKNKFILLTSLTMEESKGINMVALVGLPYLVRPFVRDMPQNTYFRTAVTGLEIMENFLLYRGQVAKRSTCPNVFLLVHNICQCEIRWWQDIRSIEVISCHLSPRPLKS